MVRNTNSARTSFFGALVKLRWRQKSKHPSYIPTTKPLKGSIWADTWSYEILDISLSIACFIALSSVLLTYDKKPFPRLYCGITLNAIISILATTSKLFLLSAVTSAIGELKWRWFGCFGRRDALGAPGRKSAMDAQLFDDASRGPWGSFLILTKRHTWSLVSIGALIMVMSTAIDPFAQQLINYPTRNVPFSEHGIMPILPVVNGIDFTIDDISFFHKIQPYLLGTLWDSLNSIFTPEPNCPTSNCTWEPFDTIAFCSYCEDLTQNAVIKGCETTFDQSDWNINDYMYVGTMAPQLCSGRRRATQLPCDPAMSNDCWWRQPKHHHR
jgi:hypothetical protein